MDYWRKYFENAKGDIFEVIQQAILVAATDCTIHEFKLRRADIAELLFTCQFSRRCSGCDARAEVPPPKEEPNAGSQGAGGEESKGACSTNANTTDVKGSDISYNEVEALTDLLDEETQIVEEVLRIKQILVNSMDQSSSVLLESLRRLELMDVGVQTLMSTDIGNAVSALRKHPIKEISKLSRGLVRSWKAMVSEWVAVTEAAKGSKDSPDSVNPSGIIDEEECGLPSPPLDEGAFFAPETNSMELSKFFDDLDDFGNLDGGRIDDKNRRMTNIRNENKNVEKRKPHFPWEQNVLPENNNSHPVLKQEAVVRQTNPSNTGSGVAKPSKLGLEQESNHEMKLHQRVDTTRTQRQPVSTQSSEQPFDKKLEMAKRKLHQGYQQAENAKKQRTIQVMELHDLPKQGFGSNSNNSKNSHARPGSRNWTNGRR